MKLQRAILDSSPEMDLITRTVTTVFLRVNKILAEVLGVPKEELENRSLFELFPKEEAEA